MYPRLFGLLMLIQLAAPPVEARLFRRRSTRGASISLRRRLNVNPLITDPGTVEVEWNNAWTWSRSYSMPTTLKWTPEGSHVYWGRTEFSANLDAISSVDTESGRVTHSSDHLTLAGTSLIADREHWNFAFAPLATFALRDHQGARLGGVAIVRYDRGRGSAGATVTWTGATNPSADNPSGTWDIGGGYGRAIGGKFTAHGDVQYERSTGIAGAWSLFEGVEYQYTDNLAIDVSAQHISLFGGERDHQLVAGITMNLGKPARWFHGSRNERSQPLRHR
jgi:hypothetical protein